MSGPFTKIALSYENLFCSSQDYSFLLGAWHSRTRTRVHVHKTRVYKNIRSSSLSDLLLTKFYFCLLCFIYNIFHFRICNVFIFTVFCLCRNEMTIIFRNAISLLRIEPRSFKYSVPNNCATNIKIKKTLKIFH